MKFRGLPGLCAVTLLALTVRASAVTLDGGDGLKVTFSDQTGGITTVSADGTDIPLIANQWGGLAIQTGRGLTPATLLDLRFDSDSGDWVSAQNAEWETGAFAARKADGGVDGTGGLLLGDGSSLGVGMAVAKPIPVQGGSRIKIHWQARVRDIKTLQIVGLRAYDATGADITARSGAQSGWAWTTQSRCHGIWGIECSSADTWQRFEYAYRLPNAADNIRLCIRYWNGGDGWVAIDNVGVEVVSGIEWGEITPVSGPVQPSATGFTQSVDVPGLSLHADVDVSGAADPRGKLDVHVTLQDTSTPAGDRPVLVYWTLPVAVSGWRWWDDLDNARIIEDNARYTHNVRVADHPVSEYPYSAIGNAQCGLSLAVPMDEPLVQRFECIASTGLRSVWEIGLSPITKKLGPGRASFSCCLYAHDPAWGLRSATARYHALYPQYFVRRSSAEGAWASAVHPGSVPNPQDFGWAFFQTPPLEKPDERALCAELGIGIFHEVEPWVLWQAGWEGVTVKPSYEDRIGEMKRRAVNPDPDLINWKSSGGVNDSGYLLLSDGAVGGAGMATPKLKVEGGNTLSISWQQKVHNTETGQIVGVRLFDASGKDITESAPRVGGWWYSPGSRAAAIWGIRNKAVDTWETFSYEYPLPKETDQIRVSIRHWNRGDHRAHLDNVRISCGDRTVLDWNFDAPDGGWISARNYDWDHARNLWFREDRKLGSQIVLNCSPLDKDGTFLIDRSGYLCRLGDWGAYSQGWPVNPDPDLPPPSAYQLFYDKWVIDRLDEAAGVFINSVMVSSGMGDWENRRPDHLALADFPLTFSWSDGGAAQLAPQAHQEFLRAIAAEMHARGKLMMLNLFSDASRFHAHTADILGSEVFQPVESARRSRIRRAMAGKRVVTSLLQYNLGLTVYAGEADVEKYIRDQLFWGFYPSVSSIGGPMNARTPERYFKRANLYERDRSIWQRYMPIVRPVSAAGWEPITQVAPSPMAEVERFGDFARGPVYVTLRGTEGAAFAGQLAIDLDGCGLRTDLETVAVKELLTGQALEATRSEQILSVTATVPAGEVRVLRLEPATTTQAN